MLMPALPAGNRSCCSSCSAVVLLARAVSRQVPITVITGFLGAGKTTLVNNILQGEDRWGQQLVCHSSEQQQ